MIVFSFATGWTPCTGPILAGVIVLGVSNPVQGILYMIAYVFGFSIPFLLMSFFISRVKWLRKDNRLIMKFSGEIMIVMGVFLYFDCIEPLFK